MHRNPTNIKPKRAGVGGLRQAPEGGATCRHPPQSYLGLAAKIGKGQNVCSGPGAAAALAARLRVGAGNAEGDLVAAHQQRRLQQVAPQLAVPRVAGAEGVYLDHGLL
jgi:hypothetical protein